MEPKPEIKRVFPKCWKCDAILAQCCCAASRNEREALAEYMAVREQLADLEGRELECKCGDFFMCDLCREAADKSHQLRGIMEQWGDNWATRLASEAASQPAPAPSCTVCGTGMKREFVCPKCGSSPAPTEAQPAPAATPHNEITCPVCRGTGSEIESGDCSGCAGRGVIAQAALEEK